MSGRGMAPKRKQQKTREDTPAKRRKGAKGGKGNAAGTALGDPVVASAPPGCSLTCQKCGAKSDEQGVRTGKYDAHSYVICIRVVRVVRASSDKGFLYMFFH